MDPIGSIDVRGPGRSKHAFRSVRPMPGWISSCLGFRFQNQTSCLINKQGCTNEIVCDLHSIS